MLVLTFSVSCPLVVVDIVFDFGMKMEREDVKLIGGRGSWRRQTQGRYDGGV
jgi:hypothetical protein